MVGIIWTGQQRAGNLNNIKDERGSEMNRITITAGKRGGKPCIRNLRITVYDVLGWLANGMSVREIIEDFPEIEEADITACLSFAAQREHNLITLQAA